MSEPVIPFVPDNASPAVIAKRKTVAMAHAAFTAIGSLSIKAAEAEKAAELLTYLDGVYARECKELDNLIATEALGRPMEVDGTKLSVAH